MTDVFAPGDLHWFDHGGQAACTDHPIDWWYSNVERDVSRAVAVCAVCPVKAECRSYAHRIVERHGTWGGETEFERGAIFAELHKGGRPRSPIRHGSPGGASAHKRRGEVPCGPCREADLAARRRNREDAKARKKAAVS